MATKTCSKCTVTKTVESFNRDASRKDGRSAYCRDCDRARAKVYISRPEIILHREQTAKTYYAKNKERIYQNVRNYRATVKGKRMAATSYAAWAKSATGKAWLKAFNDARPEMAKARHAVRMAIKRGVLARPEECETCWQRGVVQAHHYKGYQKENWLHVQWLCIPCHNHANRKK